MEKACGLHCTKIQGISVTIGKQEILKNVNIHIHCGQLTVIIGRNGAGKSTLLKAILGEVKHEGSISFVDQRDHKAGKIKIGYVPQSINVEKHMPETVYDVCASFISKVPVWAKKDQKTYDQIKRHLSIFGAENLLDKGIGNLSGGELQRVLLAIATNPLPNLLILDEPVSGIDRNGILQFYQMVDKLKKEYDISIILVSHDLKLVKKYADKVILLDKTILKEGTAEEVYQSKEFIEVFGEVE